MNCFLLSDPTAAEPPSNENMISLIDTLGEYITDLGKAGRTFVKNIFPKKDPETVVMEDVPSLMREAAKSQEGRLRSSVRGGARTTLALMLAHYRTAKPARLAYGMPLTVGPNANCKRERERAREESNEREGEVCVE